MIHEMGHGFGSCVPRTTTEVADGKPVASPPPNNLYYDRGSAGTAATARAEAPELQEGQCVMFHEGTPARPHAFCPECAKIVKRANLTATDRMPWPSSEHRTGARNVRGHAWWVAALVVAAVAVVMDGRRRAAGEESGRERRGLRKGRAGHPNVQRLLPGGGLREPRGIAIAMPKQVPLGRVTTRVPVCGAYAFTAAEFAKPPEFPYGIAFLVRTSGRTRPSRGTSSDEFEDDEPVPPPAPPANPDRVLGGYFNVNLVPMRGRCRGARSAYRVVSLSTNGRPRPWSSRS